MKLIEMNWSPSNRQLRQFGALCFVFLPFIGWIWGVGLNVTLVLCVVGLVVAMVGFTMPIVLKPFFLGIQMITLPVGILLSEVAMLLLFFGVFLPFGLFFRITRRDALKKSLHSTEGSYWEAKRQPTSVAMYYRQS